MDRQLDLATVDHAEGMAVSYSEQGRAIDAEVLYSEIIAFRRSVQGVHPDLATSLHRFGVLYLGEGRLADAERLLLDALAVREAVLEATNPALMETMEVLAQLYGCDF